MKILVLIIIFFMFLSLIAIKRQEKNALSEDEKQKILKDIFDDEDI